jgi:hypothetical protein
MFIRQIRKCNRLAVIMLVLVLVVLSAASVSAKAKQPTLGIMPPDRVSQWWLEALGYTCWDPGIHSGPFREAVCTKGGDRYHCVDGMCVRFSKASSPWRPTPNRSNKAALPHR